MEILDLLAGCDDFLRLGIDAVRLTQVITRFKQAAANQGPVVWAGLPAGPPVPMQQFRPQMADPFGGGGQWLPHLQAMAAGMGHAWVPEQTADFLGLDLTGIWAPPMNPADQCYLRQYGPYVNFIAGILGMPYAFGEGIFSPNVRAVFIQGRYVGGAPLQATAQLLPNWVLQGGLQTWNALGMPFQVPLYMARLA